MTAHDHREYVEGCYRCDLGRDEVYATQMYDRRDALAEQWLIEKHDHDWYLGSATTDEWKAAYAAVDAALAHPSFGQSGDSR